MARTYLYKLTSDRGGAPSAPPPREGEAPLLSLSICKPAIRRTAEPGDRILGLTSRSLAQREGYPLHAIIYAAVVSETMDARDYYAQDSEFRHRPDCIYEFHRLNGTIEHTGRTRLHANTAYRSRDIGLYPYYKNGRTLLCERFRYFGPEAVAIPSRLYRLQQIAESLGQGHRVFEVGEPAMTELDALLRHLWSLQSRYTPGVVEDETYGHCPKEKERP